MKISLLKSVQCKRCSLEFFVCHSCWRGQAYCSDQCREASRREAHNISQQKYRQTEKGKKTHCRQERNRRLRNSKKTMDDTPSTLDTDHDNLPVTPLPATLCCHFCGRKGQIVDQFPRRGYGGRYATYDVSVFYTDGG